MTSIASTIVTNAANWVDGSPELRLYQKILKYISQVSGQAFPVKYCYISRKMPLWWEIPTALELYNKVQAGICTPFFSRVVTRL